MKFEKGGDIGVPEDVGVLLVGRGGTGRHRETRREMRRWVKAKFGKSFGKYPRTRRRDLIEETVESMLTYRKTVGFHIVDVKLIDSIKKEFERIVIYTDEAREQIQKMAQEINKFSAYLNNENTPFPHPARYFNSSTKNLQNGRTNKKQRRNYCQRRRDR